MPDSALPTAAAVSDRWWLPIGLLVVLIPVVGIFTLLTPPDAYSLLVVAPFSLVGFALYILSPIFVYYDKRYVRTVSGWEPSGWYYWMSVPVLGLVLPFAYIYQRHKYVGVP